MGDGFFASFQTPDEYAKSMTSIRKYAVEFGRPNGHIESGLILLCRIATSRQKALDEMEPMLKALGRGAEQFLERTVYGTAEDVIGRVSEYTSHGLDKFVLWPIATPDAWAKQVELVGSEIANHYMKAAA